MVQGWDEQEKGSQEEWRESLRHMQKLLVHLSTEAQVLGIHPSNAPVRRVPDCFPGTRSVASSPAIS